MEERPSLLSAPPARYPDLLKQARIQGRVLLRAIVDTTGRVEPGSVVIATSPNPGFDLAAREWILKALFRPARMHGKAVRVHITQPLDYSVSLWKVGSFFFIPLLFLALKIALVVGVVLFAVWLFKRNDRRGRRAPKPAPRSRQAPPGRRSNSHTNAARPIATIACRTPCWPTRCARREPA